MRQDDLVDVESVADELYGLPLDEFTPTRTVRQKQATSAGDKALAAQIHGLAKPNLTAWLANQLVREHADEIRQLLELGAELREATATLSGEQLRDLSRQQRRLVYALVQQARGLASPAGRKVSTDTERGLENTLRAALASQDASDALAAARLTGGMRDSGLGSHPGQDEPSVRPTKKPTTAAAPSRTARKRAPEERTRAEHDVDRAKSAADKANTVRQEAHDVLEGAHQTVAETRGRVQRVRRELDEALQAQSGAEKDQRQARAALDRADRARQNAQRNLAEATGRLDQLTK